MPTDKHSAKTPARTARAGGTMSRKKNPGAGRPSPRKKADRAAPVTTQDRKANPTSTKKPADSRRVAHQTGTSPSGGTIVQDRPRPDGHSGEERDIDERLLEDLHQNLERSPLDRHREAVPGVENEEDGGADQFDDPRDLAQPEPEDWPVPSQRPPFGEP